MNLEPEVGHLNTVESDEEATFVFKVSCEPENFDSHGKLLVDCGAIIHDIDKFVNFDKDFHPESYFLELADGSKKNNVAKKRGTVSFKLMDSKNKSRNVLLENALYVPTFRQDIFSVQAAVEQGASVIFNPEAACLKSPNGTTFDISKEGKLYYLNNVVASKTV